MALQTHPKWWNHTFRDPSSFDLVPLIFFGSSLLRIRPLCTYDVRPPIAFDAPPTVSVRAAIRIVKKKTKFSKMIAHVPNSVRYHAGHW